MAGFGVKLMDLKVADLRRELEERELDTTGTKTVLQNRLRQALSGDGIDPDTFLFETSDFGKLQNKLEETLVSKLQENKLSLESKLEENKSFLENKLEEKLLENKQSVESKLEQNKEMFKAKVDELAGKLDTKISDLEGRLKCLENGEGSSALTAALESKLNGLEERLEWLEKGEVGPSSTKIGLPDSQGKTGGIKEPYQVPVVLPAQHGGLPTFDGKMPWKDYLSLFETAAMVYGWTPAVRAAMLSLSLRGDALAVLQTVPVADRWNVNELISRLEMRFGHRHMEQVYRSQLKNRIQKPNESLQEFETDIARLVRSAYPSVDGEVYESLAVEKFSDGLREPETQQAIKLARPKTLGDALTQALEFEAVRQSVRSHVRVRAMEAEREPPAAVEEIVRRVLEKLRTVRKEARCWGCGEKGHLRSKCRNKLAEKEEQGN